MGLLLKKCAASRRRELAAPSGLGRHAADGITPVGVSQPSQRADLERVGGSGRQIADDHGRPRGDGFLRRSSIYGFLGLVLAVLGPPEVDRSRENDASSSATRKSLLLVSKSKMLTSKSHLLTSKREMLTSKSHLLASKREMLTSKSHLLASKSETLTSKSHW